MSLLKDGKIFYIKMGMADYIKINGNNHTVGEYVNWVVLQFSNALNINLDYFDVNLDYLCFSLPYINEPYPPYTKFDLCIANSSSNTTIITKNTYLSELLNLQYTYLYLNIGCRFTNALGDNESIFINFDNYYIYKNSNGTVYKHEIDPWQLGIEINPYNYTTFIIDTRFLDSHGFYNIGAISEHMEMEEGYVVPSVFVCDMFNKFNNDYFDGIFFLNSNDSEYTNNGTGAIIDETGSYPKILEIKYQNPSIPVLLPARDVSVENKNFYKVKGVLPQAFTMDDDSFSIVKLHFGKIRPAKDIYLTEITNSLLSSFCFYENMLTEQNNWKKVTQIDEYNNKRIFLFGLNSYSDGGQDLKGEWIPVIEEKHPKVKGYLEFSSDEDFVLKVSYSGAWDGIMEYSIDDGSTWEQWYGYDEINGTSTQSILLRGTGNTRVTHTAYWTFTGKYIKGNIETLLDYKTVLNGKHPPMSDSCYRSIFRDCESLIEAPELPATTLTRECYACMFQGCTSLIEAPELPATTVAHDCYEYMFYGCTSLTKAPELPATTLGWYCYYGMFFYCSSLIEAPALPATTLIDGCYCHMFSGCTSLTKAPELPATTLAGSCYENMFSACPSLTKAPELPATTLAYSCYENMFHYCTSLIEAPELPVTELANRCYNGMFSGCESLTKAPELPATELTEQCYADMFNDCALLTKAPELPAAKLAERCYEGMFAHCISLTKTPKLLATELAAYCYISMFYGCTSLTKAPELPATELANRCYAGMFSNCALLTKAPELPATELADYCYDGMFHYCTSLIEAPELPATTLAQGCYAYMFENCTSLIEAPKLPATILADSCYAYMFEDCISLTKIPELPATKFINDCYVYMFYNCSKIKISSTQSTEYPYKYRIPKEGTGTPASTSSLNQMFYETGGSFKGTPKINKTYYTSNEVV